jgi:hypothetical protein
MNKHILSLIVALIFSVVICNVAYSWNDDKTHKDLSRYAAQVSVLGADKGDYLQHLGFTKGLKEEIKLNETNTVIDWMAKGAELEDSTPRYLNHFHNPIEETPWDNAGLNDTIYSGMSSLLWAQNGAAQGGLLQGGDWSWQKVRQIYYWALTSGKGVTSVEKGSHLDN